MEKNLYHLSPGRAAPARHRAAAGDARRGDRADGRVRARAAHARRAHVQPLRRDQAPGVGGLPRPGHAVGARALPARSSDAERTRCAERWTAARRCHAKPPRHHRLSRLRRRGRCPTCARSSAVALERRAGHDRRRRGRQRRRRGASGGRQDAARRRAARPLDARPRRARASSRSCWPSRRDTGIVVCSSFEAARMRRARAPSSAPTATSSERGGRWSERPGRHPPSRRRPSAAARCRLGCGG